MHVPTSWIEPFASNLIDHLDHLRQMLLRLTNQLRAAIAESISQTVARVVREVFHSLLEGLPVTPGHLRSSHHLEPMPWQESARRASPDFIDHWDDEDDDLPIASPPNNRIWRRLFGLSCQALSYGLSCCRWRLSLTASTGVGLLSALAAYISGPTSNPNGLLATTCALPFLIDLIDSLVTCFA